MGKNFSGNNLGQRKKSDMYETPYSMTDQFLDMEEFQDKRQPILEPACGNKAIVKVLLQHGYKDIEFYDKKDGQDFMDESLEYPYLITNPPFSLAFEFIQKAKMVATEKFALLLPLSYLHGKERYDCIWTDRKYPLARIYVFTRYPMLGDKLREDGKFRTGMQVYAWYVWQRGYKKSPEIKWIDNDRYVLRKGY